MSKESDLRRHAQVDQRNNVPSEKIETEEETYDRCVELVDNEFAELQYMDIISFNLKVAILFHKERNGIIAPSDEQIDLWSLDFTGTGDYEDLRNRLKKSGQWMRKHFTGE